MPGKLGIVCLPARLPFLEQEILGGDLGMG